MLSYFDENVILLIKDQPIVDAVIDKKFTQAENAFAETNDETTEPDELFTSPENYQEEIHKFSTQIYFGNTPTQTDLIQLSVDAKPQPDFMATLNY